MVGQAPGAGECTKSEQKALTTENTENTEKDKGFQ